MKKILLVVVAVVFPLLVVNTLAVGLPYYIRCEGYNARAAGVTRTPNPYYKSRIRWLALDWDYGWEEADAELTKMSPPDQWNW